MSPVPDGWRLRQTQSGADANRAYIEANPGHRDPWDTDTDVLTARVPRGTEFQMVVSRGQAAALARGEDAFGGFATPDAVRSQRFARGQLAILDEFKDDVSMVVTVRTTRAQDVNYGVVGSQGPSAPGGARQVQFLNPSLQIVDAPRRLHW